MGATIWDSNGAQNGAQEMTMAQTPFFTVFVTYVISSNPSGPAKDKRVSKRSFAET